MIIKTKTFTEKTAGFCDIIDITGKIQEQIDQEKIQRGVAIVFVSGSTAALTTIEFESGLVRDLKELVEKLVPSDRRYHHDDRWGDDNGFSTYAPHSSARHWRCPSRTAVRCLAPGNRWCLWILTTDRARAKL